MSRMAMAIAAPSPTMTGRRLMSFGATLADSAAAAIRSAFPSAARRASVFVAPLTSMGTTNVAESARVVTLPKPLTSSSTSPGASG
jgi:hypothetical protein